MNVLNKVVTMDSLVYDVSLLLGRGREAGSAKVNFIVGRQESHRYLASPM